MKERPFRDVVIYPSYSRKTAVVTWVVAPFLKDARFYIYKKYDGGAPYKLLNTKPVYGTTYADTSFEVPNKVDVPHYKILAILDNKEEYESPDVALFSYTDRRAFGIAQNIIRANYLQARQDGIPVLYYPAIRNGKMSSALDDITGQRESATCNETGTSGNQDEDKADYGTFYEGGYFRPFLTFIRLMGAKLQKENILDEGIFEESVQQATFLSFPPVRTGDMVVDVATDRRWFVGTSIQAHLVKSIIPVSYTASLTLQSHNHPCYAVPIPENYQEMLYRLTWPSML